MKKIFKADHANYVSLLGNNIWFLLDMKLEDINKKREAISCNSLMYTQ